MSDFKELTIKKIVMPYSLIEVYRRFGGTSAYIFRVNDHAKEKVGSKEHPDGGVNTFLQNSCKFLPDYMVLHSRR
jgi:hypothetical protein